LFVFSTVRANFESRYASSLVVRFEPITPIAEPRGLPENVSAEVKAESDEWGIDGHSHSWLTLAELDAVPWQKNLVRLCGFVDPREFQEYEKAGEPGTWTYSLDRRGYSEVTNDEMRELIATRELDEPENEWSRTTIGGTLYLTEVAWSHTWAEVATELLASMEKLRVAGAAEGFEPDQLRYVFWFDN